MEVGSHIRFKRKLFEDYLDTGQYSLSDRIEEIVMKIMFILS